MAKKKRTFKNEAKLNSVGITYNDFTPIEVARIVNDSIYNGPTGNKFKTMLAGIEKQKDFVERCISLSSIGDSDEYESLKTVIDDKKETMKEEELKAAKEALAKADEEYNAKLKAEEALHNSKKKELEEKIASLS